MANKYMKSSSDILVTREMRAQIKRCHLKHLTESGFGKAVEKQENPARKWMKNHVVCSHIRIL